MRMTSGEGPGSGAGVGSQGSLLVTFLDKSDPSLGSRGEGWAGECGAGTPLCVCGGAQATANGHLPSPLSVSCIHSTNQDGRSRYFCGGAKALGLGPEHLGSNPALPPALCDIRQVFQPLWVSFLL